MIQVLQKIAQTTAAEQLFQQLDRILEAIKCLEAGLVPGWSYEGEGPPYKTVEVCDRQSGTLLFILKTPGGAEVTIEPKQEQIGNYLSSDFVKAYISSIRIH